jgi:hypothetical protein
MQNLQAMAQPTWVETQSVFRSGAGMYTLSMSRPSRVRQRYLMVPSVLRCSRSFSSGSSAHRSRSLARSDFERSVIWSKSVTPRW